MEKRILLLGHEKVAGLALAAMAIQLDLVPVAATWSGFDPRSFGRKQRPSLVVAHTDALPGEGVEPLCQMLRSNFGQQLPILAATAARRFSDTERLFEAGIDDCLPPLPEPELFARKIARCLNRDRAHAASSLVDDELPEALAGVFRSSGEWKTLGDYATVHAGAAPRRNLYRRMAPPDSSWRGVLTGEDIGRFAVAKPSQYLRWTRLHLFRLPSPEEYSVREKVVLRRAGPPLTAAVDRSRLPAGPDAYSIVPMEEIPAGFIACLLNSRIVDFYFNRLPGASAADGRLRPEPLRRLPLPEPDAGLMSELAKTASLLAHFGPNPQSWVDRQRRDELAESMDEALFGLYGVGASARGELAALHF